jgi:drug/metabolite transporter (DMT)-like permease
MIGVRWFCAGALLYGVLRWRGAPSCCKSEWRVAAIIGAGIIFAGNGSVTYAEQFMPSGTVAVIVALVPALMALMGWLSGMTSRPPLAVWLGIALATSGVGVIVRPSGVALSRQVYLAAALLILGDALWAAASLYAGRIRQFNSAFLMAATQMLCGGACLILIAIARGELRHFDVASVTMRSLLALGYLISFGSIVGFSAFVWLLRNLEPTRVATYAYVYPVVAVLLGWLFAREVLAPQLLAGSGLVVLGVALIVTFRSKGAVKSFLPDATQA